jgi:hypothetical protein
LSAAWWLHEKKRLFCAVETNRILATPLIYFLCFAPSPVQDIIFVTNVALQMQWAWIFVWVTCVGHVFMSFIQSSGCFHRNNGELLCQYQFNVSNCDLAALYSMLYSFYSFCIVYLHASLFLFFGVEEGKRLIVHTSFIFIGLSFLMRCTLLFGVLCLILYLLLIEGYYISS